VRQHVVAGEEHALLLVEEHHVSPGVPRRVQHTELALVGQRDHAAVIQPAVRRGPHRIVERRLGREHDLGEIARPGLAQHGDLAGRFPFGPGGELGDAGALGGADADAGTPLAADDDRERVVVAVRVRHQHVGDVLQAEAHQGQRRGQLLLRLGDGPAAVDEHHAGAADDGVHVDCLEPVMRHRERDTEDTRCHRVGAGPLPVMRCLRVVLRHRGDVLP
jgi:hypothetical protein